MARAPSVPSASLDHHTATAPLVAPDPSLRSTPVNWGSPAPAAVPSQAPVQPPTLTPTPFEPARPSLTSGSPPGQTPQPPVSQTGASRDTAAASVTHESLSQHAAPLPMGAPMELRSTPVDWGSSNRTQPPMSIPSQASVKSVTAAPTSASAALSARVDTEAARSHVPFSTSSSAAAVAPSAAVAPGQALTDDMPAGEGTHSSGQGRAGGSHASGLQPTGPEAGFRDGRQAGEVSLGTEVQAASTATRGIASVRYAP